MIKPSIYNIAQYNTYLDNQDKGVNKPYIKGIEQQSNLRKSTKELSENAIKIEDGAFELKSKGSKSDLMNTSQSSSKMTRIMSRMVEKRLDCEDVKATVPCVLSVFNKN